jgi:predicted TIM-barrel enzyme
VATVREAVPEGFILLGSGVDEDNASRLLSLADGAIVGTSLKRDGIVSNPMDSERVKRMAEIIGGLP